jgi:5-hydroxyisourate hydrolase
MSGITTHILDTSRGRPAAGVTVVLSLRTSAGGADAWREIGRGETDADGRLRTLVPADAALELGVYRITFDTGGYFAALGVEGFYPEASIVFTVRADEHHHVPLLLNPFGYSTYRGS